MANEIDPIDINVDADVGLALEPSLYERRMRIVTTAHPFNDDDLRDFATSGEHLGLD